MRRLVIPMEKIRESDRDTIGSKAFSLHDIAEAGLKVPVFVCISTRAYEIYLESSSLKGSILLELSRKDIKDMRWEEMWDTSLRIRNMFLNTPMSEGLDRKLRGELNERFTDIPVVVRSSAPGEDSAMTSFAGLHESYVNVRGMDSIMDHIRLVWASLWSDAALLYREELGLEIEHSSMSVIVQELIEGDTSGIVFSKSPDNGEQMVIEAVHGLNKGLVDGDVDPDRWMIDRKTAFTIRHDKPSDRERLVVLSNTGTVLKKANSRTLSAVPLSENDINELYKIAQILERRFVQPQDIEWTIKDGVIYVLQSRPVTASEDNEKLWYLSLSRTIENLKDLRKKIENELIPAMISDVRILQSIKPALMDNRKLAREIVYRKRLYESWDKKYKDEFIPFAHGMRLFGQVYNDVIRPSNPYEFMDLLQGAGLLSIKRNEDLNRLAGKLRKNSSLLSKAKENEIGEDLRKDLEDIFSIFGHAGIFKTREAMLKHIVELASSPEKVIPEKKDISYMENRFISAFTEENRSFAEELLDIGRTSYRLRDNDNIYLGRIENQFLVLLDEAKRRVASRVTDIDIDDIGEEELLKALDHDNYIPAKKVRAKEESFSPMGMERIRQIRGQPAGKGLVTGIARVIVNNEDLFNARYGEILVCDSINPNMTFVVPLASGIVERRGGMLIHGAIIAREYGIPCVTGIPDATRIIKNGDEVTVDGYLGIVTIHRDSGRLQMGRFSLYLCSSQ
ncbi:MAG: hypothetical protein JW705_04525 [Methanosarcinaceae archaeon]|nr:hypothetical protein [Methanosarcinaceae archaeon]